MSADPSPHRSHRLLKLELRSESDLIVARQRTRQVAAALGFDSTEQARLATALSEIARNAWQYAGSGAVEFAVVSEGRVSRGRPEPTQALVIRVEDRGPGIRAEVLEASADPSAAGPGLGLPGARRLVDRMEVRTSPAGTAVEMGKALPAGASHAPARLQAIADDLARQPAASPIEELQAQNRELLRALEDVRAREQELTRVNQEITETNSGVLALYDELETLHRVGLMLAERHNLHDLLQTIIDATTELTGAELGAFYYHESSTGTWRLNAISGKARAALARLPVENPAGFFGAEEPDGAMSCSCSAGSPGQTCARWIELLAEIRPVQSCLFVPVKMANSELVGALIFGHSAPQAFSERGERIVAAVAVQAAVGIEKARLFHNLQTVSEAKDRFLAMLSHELRTPLNPVAATLSALAEDPALPSHLREDVDLMRRNVDLEARLIDDLLDFNRIVRGKLHLHREPVDFHALVRSVADICRAELTERGQSLRVELAAPRSIVSGDAARLQQVLWNLLKNAIKFSPAGGAISIRSEAMDEGQTLRVEIIDNGRGISAEALPTIFSAFEQGDFRAGNLGGLGLGLSIAKTFMDLHGGKISAASAGPGEGARFTLQLPLLPAEAGARAAAERPATVAPGAPVGRRILLVDDHRDTLRSLSRLLTRRGHAVRTAENYEEALALAAAEPFDVLVSDIGLPDRSGLELVAELRRMHPMPAIALSGYGMEDDLSESSAAGFDRHLTKPVNFSLLEKAIAELCSTQDRPA